MGFKYVPLEWVFELVCRYVAARDIAHAKIKARLDAGEGMPQYMKDHAVYYAGPAKTPDGMASGSFGPTTAGRMDSYVADERRLLAELYRLVPGGGRVRDGHWQNDGHRPYGVGGVDLLGEKRQRKPRNLLLAKVSIEDLRARLEGERGIAGDADLRERQRRVATYLQPAMLLVPPVRGHEPREVASRMAHKPDEDGRDEQEDDECHTASRRFSSRCCCCCCCFCDCCWLRCDWC